MFVAEGMNQQMRSKANVAKKIADAIVDKYGLDGLFLFAAAKFADAVKPLFSYAIASRKNTKFKDSLDVFLMPAKFSEITDMKEVRRRARQLDNALTKLIKIMRSVDRGLTEFDKKYEFIRRYRPPKEMRGEFRSMRSKFEQKLERIQSKLERLIAEVKDMTGFSRERSVEDMIDAAHGVSQVLSTLVMLTDASDMPSVQYIVRLSNMISGEPKVSRKTGELEDDFSMNEINFKRLIRILDDLDESLNDVVLAVEGVGRGGFYVPTSDQEDEFDDEREGPPRGRKAMGPSARARYARELAKELGSGKNEIRPETSMADKVTKVSWKEI